MRAVLALLTALISSVPLCAAAQEQAAEAGAEPAQEVRDYSGGFRKFMQLGLPDVADAAYVKLDIFGGVHIHSRMHDLQLAGNAWLLEENEQGASRFVVGGCRVVEVYDHEALARERRERAEAEAKDGSDGSGARRVRIRFHGHGAEDGKVGGRWQPVELEEDVDATLAYLEKKAEEGGRDWVMQSGGYGQVFLNAIHFHRKGFEEQANRMVGLLFQRAGDRSTPILQALNQLGDGKYEETCDRFFASADWNAYGDELATLLERFKAGWQKRPAVEKLLLQVRARAGQEDVPAVEGDGLSEEDAALAAELASVQGSGFMAGGFMFGNRPWILDPPPDEADLDGASVVERIKARGFESVPLLMALLEDDYLTPADLQSFGGAHVYSHYNQQRGPLTEHQITQMYKAMRRPASRGDIAEKLLAPLPIGPPDRRYRGDIDRVELQDECAKWLAEARGKNRLELAQFYTRRGNDEQRRAAMQVLLESGSDEDMAAIEQALLESSRSINDMQAARQYVDIRGEKAAEFVDKFEARVREQLAAFDQQQFRSDQMKEHIEKAIQDLRQLVSVKPADEILAELLAGKGSFNELSTGLRRQLSRQDPSEALTLLLETAVKAEDSGLAKDLVYFAAQVPRLKAYSRMSHAMPYGRYEEPQPAELDIAAHAGLWKALLEDERVVVEPHATGGRMTVAESAIWTIETLYDEDNARAARTVYRDLGLRLMDVLRERAEARLSGKAGDALPPLPSADEVPAERTAALVETLKSGGEEAMAQTVRTLTAAELLALTAAANEDEALNARLAPFAHRVVRLGADAGSETPPLLEDAGIKVGDRLARSLAERLFALCKQQAEAGKPASFIISRQPGLDGVVIDARTTRAEEAASRRGYMGFARGDRAPTAHVSGHVGGGSINGNATWLVDEPKPAAEADGAGADAGDDDLLDAMFDEADDHMANAMSQGQERYWEQVEKLCAGEGNVCMAGWIQFWSIPAETETEEAAAGDDEGNADE